MIDTVPYPAGALYRSGVRAIALERPVDLADPAAEDRCALDAVRLATSHGIRVSWEIGVPSATIGDLELSHLHPPGRIAAPDGEARVAAWWEEFYLDRCCWRQGPGFVEIRDRRSRRLDKYILTEPELIAALHAVDKGEDVPAETVRPLLDEGLVLPLGDALWLAPYRAVRWPMPSLTT